MATMRVKIYVLILCFGILFLIGFSNPVAAISPLPQSEGTRLPVELMQASETLTIAETITTTETITPTETVTPIETVEPAPTSTPTPFMAYFPLLMRQLPPIPPETVLFCDSLSQPEGIPDNQAAGMANTIFINDSRSLTDLNVRVNISHTWVGDLTVDLTHQETGRKVRLIDRPGIPGSDQGCSNNDIVAILDDDISAPVDRQCAASPAAISGIYIPEQPLAIFRNEIVAGNWTLAVADNDKNDTGTLKGWCMAASISESPPPAAPTPPPPALPLQASVPGVTGQKQALPLDCESRVAVDWARFFGVSINELEFLGRLPKSDNPDAGFVGNVYGAWGQIPPYPYGVHAEPVAALLREYGVNAYAHRPLSWDGLRAEIAAGRPVYVFAIGSASFNEVPIYYRAQDGHLTIVAHYEHTVMVTGYTENTVTILDGGTAHTRSLNQFLSSWSALGNMAITARP